jgi:hypothetical protein
MIFNGTFYFTAAVDGHVTGAVFMAFFNMMTDFVNRYHDKFASTDDFRQVANEHFARTPFARQHNLTNLDWFFYQWVYHTELPSYHIEYQLQDQPDGKVLLMGTITQENAPD